MKVAFILCLVLAVAAASPLDRSQALALHALAELRVTQAAEQLAATGNAVVVIPGGGVSQILIVKYGEILNFDFTYWLL